MTEETMSWREVIYQYDGSFDGLLCCVYESYVEKELPTAVISDGEASLFEVRAIVTDRAHAARVYASLQKYSSSVGPFLRRAHLTCLPEKEILIYRFIRKLYAEGKPLLSRLADPDYQPLLNAVRHMNGEAQLLRGFLRFSEFDGMLAAEIEPKNRVLPLLRKHFCDRYYNEMFLIYDRTHREALIYAGGRSRILPLEEFHMAAPDRSEALYRSLWRQFYDTIAIRERENPKLRMTHMPKRYWSTMTEFQEDPTPSPALQAPCAASAAPCAPDGIPAPATPQEGERSGPASAP